MKLVSSPHYSSAGTIKNIGMIEIEDTKDLELLREIFQRALNTWEQCPPEVKEIADNLIYGKSFPPYNNDHVKIAKVLQKPKTIIQGELPVCSICGGEGLSHLFSGLTKPCPNDPRYQPRGLSKR
jgi:hypothetical protein